MVWGLARQLARFGVGRQEPGGVSKLNIAHSARSGRKNNQDSMFAFGMPSVLTMPRACGRRIEGNTRAHTRQMKGRTPFRAHAKAS